MSTFLNYVYIFKFNSSRNYRNFEQINEVVEKHYVTNLVKRNKLNLLENEAEVVVRAFSFILR